MVLIEGELGFECVVKLLGKEQHIADRMFRREVQLEEGRNDLEFTITKSADGVTDTEHLIINYDPVLEADQPVEGHDDVERDENGEADANI